MKGSCRRLAVGLMLAFSPSVCATAATTEDVSRLVAELSQAWQQGRSKDIADRFGEAQRLAPQGYRISKAYGDFLTTNRRNQEAMAAYRRAAELAPTLVKCSIGVSCLTDSGPQRL